MKAIFFDIPSESVKGKFYKVRYNPEADLWMCNCWAFINRNACKHIDKAKLLYEPTRKDGGDKT